MTHVYIIVPEGVNDQLIPAVFTTRAAAQAAARELWRDSDGYHALRVERRELNKVYDTYSRYNDITGRRATKKPSKIEYVPEHQVFQR